MDKFFRITDLAAGKKIMLNGELGVDGYSGSLLGMIDAITQCLKGAVV